MITSREAEDLVKRLNAVDEFLKSDTAAKEELARVLMDHALSSAHASDTITEVVDHFQKRPKPSELREMLISTRDKHTGKRQACPMKCTDGWQKTHLLRTRNPRTGRYDSETITAEQARDLDGKIDWRTQLIYYGVVPCVCRAGMMPPADDGERAKPTSKPTKAAALVESWVK